MRKLPLLLILALCLQITPAISQNQAFKNAIHTKLNFIDYGLMFDNELRVGQGFEFAYFRNIAPALNIGVPLKLGLAKLPGSSDANTVTAGADLQFRLENIKSSAKIIPFAFGGAGFVSEKGKVHGQFPFGAGLHFRVSPYAFINLQGEFRKALIDDRDNLQIGIGYVYLLHKSENSPVPPAQLMEDMDKDGTTDSLDLCPTMAGPPLTLGCPDADNDGVADTDDPCPNDAGPIETSGCPDYDNDGFADKDDECPTEAGTIKGCPEPKDTDGDGTPDDQDLCPDKPGVNRGCPDTDGDGIADNFDSCPDVAGSVNNNGCPEPKDSDGDGFMDDTDPCPTEPGPINGCPQAKEAKDRDRDGVADDQDPCPDNAGTIGGCPDSDGDNVADNVDKCPNTAGTAANFGCPEEKKEITAVREKLATAARAVQFESAKAILKDASYDVLDEVVAIMRQNGSYSLSISGYTDNVGEDEENLKLSQDRAKACYDYLIFRGIKADRIRYTGFGEARPIASNDSNEGREQNRRVEFELILE
ncbi:MAG: thrombospondin type 3 repeat-containing protein [Saprospiraceae bacterium]|nr:thrombospondin type 3 repeat-containing protein [Saprospiraceae bacterium]